MASYNYLLYVSFICSWTVLLSSSTGQIYFFSFPEVQAITWMKIEKFGGGECWTPANKDLKTFSDNRIICSPEDCPKGEENLPPICVGSLFPRNPPEPCEDLNKDKSDIPQDSKLIDIITKQTSSKNVESIEKSEKSEQKECVNEPPVADAGEDQNAILPGNKVRLSGIGFDDHTSTKDLKYKWSGPVELDNSDINSPSFKAPTIQQNEKEKVLTFTLTVTDEGGLSGTDNVDIKIGCNYKPHKFNGKIWKFDYEVVSEKGLVLKNIMAGDQKVFDSITIPHFKITDGYESKTIRYCDHTDPDAKWFSFEPLLSKENENNDYNYLQWSFGVKYGNSEKELVINYNIVVGNQPANNCEANSFTCYRFIPLVSFSYPESLKKFAAFYKLDLGSNIGLSSIRDSDVTLPFIINDLGRHPLLTNEMGFLAVNRGQPAQYDNIHTAHPSQSIYIPGCRVGIFDCIHMHWRWSDIEYTKLVDPMIEPSTGLPIVDPTLTKKTRDALDESLRGKPNLVPDQTIAIAIVNYHSEEDDPDDPSVLLNDEKIAIAEGIKIPDPRGGGLGFQEQCHRCYLKTGGHPIVWYVSSIENKDSNTFFRHGFFVLNTLSGKNNAETN